MKKSKWMILLLVISAALSFVIPVSAEGIDLNFGPIGINFENSYKPGIDAVTAPVCHDTVTCDAFRLVADLKAAFAENKLVPEGEWLNNKLREIRKEIADTGCKNYSIEETINSIVLDHVNYCKNTANPHLGDSSFIVDNFLLPQVENLELLSEWLIDIDVEKLKNDLQKHSAGYAYKNNCQATALSYGMCRQGYDVQAHGKYGNHYEMDHMGLDEKLKPKDIYITKDLGANTTLEAIEEKMAGWPDGTIIFIAVRWDEKSGHAFTAEKVNGEIVFLDPQLPDKNSETVRNDYLNRVDETLTNIFFRLDNIDFSDKLDQLTMWVDKKDVVEQTKY